MHENNDSKATPTRVVWCDRDRDNVCTHQPSKQAEHFLSDTSFQMSAVKSAQLK